MNRPLRLHAIYAVLDETALFRASVTSIYPHVEGITVITTYDRDWEGRRRDASPLVPLVLGRDLDPDRKIELVIANETNEARARNRAMDLAAPRRASIRVRRQHQHDDAYVVPDYFLIIDSDEIYEAGTLDRLKDHVAQQRRPLYRVACRRYFKRWNYRIEGLEWMLAFVRADQRLPYLRMRPVGLHRRAAAHLPGMPATLRSRLRGAVDIPADVGIFHHGSYVGPRSRIAAKLASFGHSHEVRVNWLEDVWDRWTPDARDFNPTHPARFPSAERVSTDALPVEIAGQPWPADYIER
jgi:hypothetical protein